MNAYESKGNDPDLRLPESLNEFQEAIIELMGDSSDIVYREVQFAGIGGLVVYVEGLADPSGILDSLMEAKNEDRTREGENGVSPGQALRELKINTLSEGRIMEIDSLGAASVCLLAGGTVVYLDGLAKALAAGTQNLKQRAVQEATSQSVVRGPREGFTESISDNTALIRRRIQNPSLRMRYFRMGEETRTSVVVMYMNGKADPNILRELYDKLEKADLPSILESNYIEEMIQDQRYSPFPTVYNSERPDVISSALLEGRIAILVDGSPFVLVVPALFMHYFQSSEDYYQRGDFASLVRLLRYFCFAIALLTPSFYIAITTYHQEMIPPNLLLSLIGQREGIPFPAFIEALIMEITFEILREAGIRLPKSIGQSVSIVGTLVIGQAAVEAGLISAAMVIVVSITAISNFALPAFNVGISARLLRFPFMVLSALFGLYGIIVLLIMLGLHLCKLESMGVPYMTSFAPFRLSDQKDALVRLMRPFARKYFGSLKKQPDPARPSEGSS
ncbi:spore germination protein [Paenibacillus agaridevorans]|uniref:Spore germination protein n=1 Tax=Paenibacillus agaridevorans TaxID=171404 RepID=A0A2R5F6R1_9BACL|nr:spore germination protein [Paenibacillus agaridevorans]GBG12214.1 spore germination protein [Paenibacillus agaridevorans]